MSSLLGAVPHTASAPCLVREHLAGPHGLVAFPLPPGTRNGPSPTGPALQGARASGAAAAEPRAVFGRFLRAEVCLCKYLDVSQA